MRLRLLLTPLALSAASLVVGGTVARASEPCATFFWTASQQAPVARYQPRYLIGQGLEDVHMDQIAGARIRDKWSTQAATCIASSNAYGYFANPAFEQTSCLPDEDCFPGTRARKLSERLADMLDVAHQLATPNAEPTYQTNLNTARGSLYLVIDALGAAPITTASFYTGMIESYDQMIGQLAAIDDQALPADGRTAVLDAMCSTDNVAQLNTLVNGCFDHSQFCNLAFLFDTISMCQGYQSGATLDAVLGQVSATRVGLTSERAQLATEHDAITSAWSQIQALHPSNTALPATCNVHESFGTAQLPLSSFTAAPPRYGADLRFLYGDWEWSTFGVTSTAAKLSSYVEDIAQLVRNCIGDVRYGRLDFARHRVADGAGGLRDETDGEYEIRALGGVVDLQAQLASIELDYTSLVHSQAPLISDAEVDTLKTTVSDTVLRVAQLTGNRTTGLGWVVELMQDFLDAKARLTQADVAARALLTAYTSEFPNVRDMVIQQLIDNAEDIRDDYGSFFSVQQQIDLEALLADLTDAGSSDDVAQVSASINQIADSMEAELDASWDANQPLGIFATELKLIFGDCTNSPTHPLFTYFGDLPVAAKILQEGHDASTCVP